jgi:hypothetical protein
MDNLGLYLRALFLLYCGQVVASLQVHPELGAVPEITRQPQGGLGGYRVLAV